MDLVYYIIIGTAIISLFYVVLPTRRIFRNSKIVRDQAREIANANEILEEQNKKLQELNFEKNQLISFVSHDLKAPLNRVFALTNLINMDSGNLTNEQKEYLKRIQTVVTDGLGLIKNLLDIRALEDKGIELNKERFIAGEALGELVRTYEHIAEKKDIRVEYEDRSQGMEIYSDRQYFTRIFENILSNAVKFAGKDTMVNVRLEREGDGVVGRIKDEGPGILEEEIPLLFQRFQILSSKPTGGETSNGLGLSITKSLLQNLGGEIWVNSEYGRGAEFCIRIGNLED